MNELDVAQLGRASDQGIDQAQRRRDAAMQEHPLPRLNDLYSLLSRFALHHQTVQRRRIDGATT
jgi:hypothetical protein